MPVSTDLTKRLYDDESVEQEEPESVRLRFGITRASNVATSRSQFGHIARKGGKPCIGTQNSRGHIRTGALGLSDRFL